MGIHALLLLTTLNPSLSFAGNHNGPVITNYKLAKTSDSNWVLTVSGFLPDAPKGVWLSPTAAGASRIHIDENLPISNKLVEVNATPSCVTVPGKADGNGPDYDKATVYVEDDFGRWKVTQKKVTLEHPDRRAGSQADSTLLAAWRPTWGRSFTTRSPKGLKAVRFGGTATVDIFRQSGLKLDVGESVIGKVEVEPGENLSVTLEFRPGDGNVTGRVLTIGQIYVDQSGSSLVLGTTDQKDQLFVYNATGSGRLTRLTFRIMGDVEKPENSKLSVSSPVFCGTHSFRYKPQKIDDVQLGDGKWSGTIKSLRIDNGSDSGPVRN